MPYFTTKSAFVAALSMIEKQLELSLIHMEHGTLSAMEKNDDNLRELKTNCILILDLQQRLIKSLSSFRVHVAIIFQ